MSITDSLNCFGQAMPIVGNKTTHLTFLFGYQYSQVLTSDLGVWHNTEVFDCTDFSGVTGLIMCWGDALSLS